MLRVGKLIDAAGDEQLLRVKNMSAGGLMAIVSHAAADRRAGPSRAFVAKNPGHAWSGPATTSSA